MIDYNTQRVVITESAAATEAVGRSVGRVLRRGDVVALDGELGAGKTVFVRGLAAGVGSDPAAVRSPTFVLHHIHRGGRVTLHHLDCYRLGPGADLEALDFDAMVDEGAVAVEWAEYAPVLARTSAVHVRIETIDERRRRIQVSDLPPHLAAALVPGGGDIP